MEKEIQVLSKYYNYIENDKVTRKAINVLENLSEEEKEIVLRNPAVQKTILSIRKIELLREIFKASPSFFQEIMFENKTVQNLLVAPRASTSEQKLKKEFNNTEGVFRAEELKKLENFIHSIKSDKVREQIVDNKLFQLVVSLSFSKQLERSFFEGLDAKRLFNNIVNDSSFFFATHKSAGRFRKRQFLYSINKADNNLLLTQDYKNALKENAEKELIWKKKASMHKGDKIVIDKNTFKMLNETMIDGLLEIEEYIDRTAFEEYLKDTVIEIMSKENFRVQDLAVKEKYFRYFFPTPTEFYYFVIASDLVKDNEALKKEYIDFLFSYTGRVYNLSEENVQFVKNAFFDKINYRMMSRQNLFDLYRQPSSLKTIFYLKFNKVSEYMYYLNKITDEQLLNINVKHVNQIVKLLPKENEDEISLIYSNAIKLYLAFGLERSLRILRGDYGPLNRHFFDSLGRLDVTNVKLKKEGGKYVPITNEGFINYMFTTEKDNHFADMLNNPDSLLSKYWNHLFEDFESIKEQCHGNMSLNRLNIILEQYSPSKDVGQVALDDYKLKEKNILEDICLGNKTAKPNAYVYKSAVDIYEQMKKRTESSIPYVKGECENGYSYEMMRLNDPIAFTLGYKANCCIRVNDIAHNHLLHATLCRNGRILIMYDKKGEVAGFAPLKRNGEVLIANSIECAHKTYNKKTIEAFSEAIKDIVQTSKSNEENPIRLVCIGREAYAKPETVPFPSNIPTPKIYEKEDSVYSNTDVYHTILDIVYKDEGLSLDKIKYEDPKASYGDPRMAPTYMESTYTNREEIDEALKVINSIRYAKVKHDIDRLEKFRKLEGYDVRKCLYSEDWYICMSPSGKIYGEYLDYDPRAEREYELAYKKFTEKMDKQLNKR